MDDIYPLDKTKLQNRISSYRRSMKKEAQEHGFIHDGYGKRFLIGPMLQLLGQVDKALEYYEWYSDAFPGDAGDPVMYLCWSLALAQKERYPEACDKLYQTIFLDLPLLPELLGMEIGFEDDEDDFFREKLPPNIAALWDDRGRAWVNNFIESDEIIAQLEDYLAIEAELESEKPGPRRSQLLDKTNLIVRAQSPITLAPGKPPEVKILAKSPGKKANKKVTKKKTVKKKTAKVTPEKTPVLKAAPEKKQRTRGHLRLIK